ncbi:MAG: NfeD family protein [Pseudomonadota bacterium]
MSSLLTELNGWVWVLIGLTLMALEALAPGVFLLWFGGAAIVTGLIAIGLDLGLTAQFLVFAALAAASCAFGARYGNQASGTSDNPNLNIRGQAYVGRVFTLSEPIENGRGRVRIGDTTWRVEGPDLANEQDVRVIGVKGASLIVEAA